MARPREITDERLLEAAASSISRLGPGFTLADVAAQAQVSVGTVAQRFGSKHGLLAAMTRSAIDGMRSGIRESVKGVEPAHAAVHALLVAYAPLDDAGTAANNLAQLAVDLADSELRGLMAEFYAVMEAEIASLIDAAALPLAPRPATAARILTAIADGTAIHWSARPQGSLRERLQDDLTTVVDGWRPRERQEA
ncbi:TetR family transcriptional regulator [Actinomadura sp. DC4]|uniref:TetR/AcrR family transcriptional regulator n=1 Tax=Actinomadura sp. DC4 TaxID=3055069 RepID=UPI0025B122DC|nr:TetR family transcriptional regulator [Actinomadura sp. DC4]MDN3359849.1 TetR family transcriptional regulator [Actinomadura sp. DC4]